MSFFFDDDICWCGNECDNIDCFRNIKNRKRIAEDHDIFTMAYLKDTELCLMTQDNEKNS